MRCFCLKAFSTSMNSKRAAGSNGIGGNRLIFPWESHRTRKSQHMPPPTPLHFTPQVWAKSILWHTMLLCYLRNANMRSVIPGCTRPRGALMVDPPLVPVVYFQATSPTGSSEQRDLWAPDQPASHNQAVHNKCTTGYVCIWFREHSSIHSHFAKIPVLISTVPPGVCVIFVCSTATGALLSPSKTYFMQQRLFISYMYIFAVQL